MQSIEGHIDSTIARIPRGLAIRGVIAVLFGIAVLVWADISLAALVFLVGAFAAVDGVISLAVAFAGVGVRNRWWLVISGIAGLGVGAIVVLNPAISALALLYVIGAWAIVLGVVHLVAAFADDMEGRYRVLQGLYGVVSIVFGTIMFVRPGAGALGVLVLISAYAIVTGVTLIAAAFEVRDATRELKADISSRMIQGHI